MQFTQTLHQIDNTLPSKQYYKSQPTPNILKLKDFFFLLLLITLNFKLFYWTSFLQLSVALYVGS